MRVQLYVTWPKYYYIYDNLYDADYWKTSMWLIFHKNSYFDPGIWRLAVGSMQAFVWGTIVFSQDSSLWKTQTRSSKLSSELQILSMEFRNFNFEL